MNSYYNMNFTHNIMETANNCTCGCPSYTAVYSFQRELGCYVFNRYIVWYPNYTTKQTNLNTFTSGCEYDYKNVSEYAYAVSNNKSSKKAIEGKTVKPSKNEKVKIKDPKTGKIVDFKKILEEEALKIKNKADTKKPNSNNEEKELERPQTPEKIQSTSVNNSPFFRCFCSTDSSPCPSLVSSSLSSRSPSPSPSPSPKRHLPSLTSSKCLGDYLDNYFDKKELLTYKKSNKKDNNNPIKGKKYIRPVKKNHIIEKGPTIGLYTHTPMGMMGSYNP